MNSTIAAPVTTIATIPPHTKTVRASADGANTGAFRARSSAMGSVHCWIGIPGTAALAGMSVQTQRQLASTEAAPSVRAVRRTAAAFAPTLARTPLTAARAAMSVQAAPAALTVCANENSPIPERRDARADAGRANRSVSLAAHGLGRLAKTCDQKPQEVEH